MPCSLAPPTSTRSRMAATQRRQPTGRPRSDCHRVPVQWNEGRLDPRQTRRHRHDQPHATRDHLRWTLPNPTAGWPAIRTQTCAPRRSSGGPSADPNDSADELRRLCGSRETVHMGDGGVRPPAARRHRSADRARGRRSRISDAKTARSGVAGRVQRSDGDGRWNSTATSSASTGGVGRGSTAPLSRACQRGTSANSSCSSATTFAPTLCGSWFENASST